MSPETAAFMEAFWAAVFCGVVLTIFFVLGHRSEDYGPTNWQRFCAYFFVTSSTRDEGEGEVMPRTSAAEPSASQFVDSAVATDRGTPVDTSTPVPRTNKRLSDAEWIALLATAKGDNGKDRFSANQIAAIIGGTRKDVLDQVRAVRNLPEYPGLKPEQQATREELQLP